jgi:hypothetical protein
MYPSRGSHRHEWNHETSILHRATFWRIEAGVAQVLDEREFEDTDAALPP